MKILVFRMRVLILLCIIAGISADCDFDYSDFRTKYADFYKSAYGYDFDTFKTKLHEFKDFVVEFKDKFDSNCFNTEDGKIFLLKYNKFMVKYEFMDTFTFEQKQSELIWSLNASSVCKIFSQFISTKRTLTV